LEVWEATRSVLTKVLSVPALRQHRFFFPILPAVLPPEKSPFENQEFKKNIPRIIKFASKSFGKIENFSYLCGINQTK
jgi:hypothetical protein